MRSLIHKTGLQLLVVTLVLLLTTYISHASNPLLDLRERVSIKIVRMERSAQNEQVSEVTELLKATLYDSGFDTQILNNLEIGPREYLSQNPFTFHIIANILPSGVDGIQASLYTKGVPSSKHFVASPAAKLVNQIRSYLESEEVVLQRLRAWKQSSSLEDKLSNHISQGLNYLLKTNELDKAIKEFQVAAKIDPGSALPHFNLALCYKRMGNYEKRKEHVNKGLELDPQNDSLRNELALIYMSEEKYHKAIEIFQSLPKNNSTFQWNLAYAYSRINQVEKSKEYLRNILEIQTDSSITSVASERLHELESKEKALGRTKKSLWIAFIGLIVIAITALITIIVKQADRDVTISKQLKPENALALKMQISVAILSGLFATLSVALPKFLSD